MDETTHASRPFWRSRSAIALLVFAAIALFLLFSEHRAHFLGVLPYLLLLSCPLMHLFMHHGHGHGHGHGHRGSANEERASEQGDGREQHR
ncbi:DUF2933 domain-containing protein [Paraburkholderia bengalensis]|uniref:DUF2933 domain-containing protein n=1 Tax=Paraburkholderia bengalensis TaxID=2747562 RepID=A0ABU8IRI0_9BURK